MNNLKSHSIGRIEAKLLYPFLPEYAKKSISQDYFADFIERLLIATGDIEDWQTCTEKGESHGFFEFETGAWLDNHTHFSFDAVLSDDNADIYTKEIIKTLFPGFDDNAFNKTIKRNNHVEQIAEEEPKGPKIEDGKSFKLIKPGTVLYCKNGETVSVNSIDNGKIYIKYKGHIFIRYFDSYNKTLFLEPYDPAKKYFNYRGFDEEGYDINGFDYYGFNRDGYNRGGFDRNGYNKNGKRADSLYEDCILKYGPSCLFYCHNCVNYKSARLSENNNNTYRVDESGLVYPVKKTL